MFKRHEPSEFIFIKIETKTPVNAIIREIIYVLMNFINLRSNASSNNVLQENALYKLFLNPRIS